VLEDSTSRRRDAYQPCHPCIYSRDCYSEHCVISLAESEACIRELAPGVLVFPLLSATFCRKVWEEMHHYISEALRLGLHLHRRFDSNCSQLEKCGFLPLLENLNASPVTYVTHAVLLHNYCNHPGADKLAQKIHQDKYRLTLNVCLHTSADLCGSTVTFYESPSLTAAVGRQQIVPKTPSPEDAIRTHQHEVGLAVLHSGKDWHSTNPIERGERGSLILWCD